MKTEKIHKGKWHEFRRQTFCSEEEEAKLREGGDGKERKREFKSWSKLTRLELKEDLDGLVEREREREM